MDLPASGLVPPAPVAGAVPRVGGVGVDRCADERSRAGLLGEVLADEQTRVLEVRRGRARVGGSPAGLLLRPPTSRDADATSVFLGRDAAGAARVAVAGDGEGPEEDGWSGLREVGSALGEVDVELFLTALGVLNWHATHGFCPRCGARTEIAAAGWTRRCPVEGGEHYPRTDPAVIMAVVDSADRLLLARGPCWPPGRRSVLAGFVEPGERLEEAVAREVLEEVGVRVGEVAYGDSQPWPFPASLMVGFTARAASTRLTPDTAEIAEAHWFTRRQLLDDVAAGRVLLPGRLSIARRLIEGWMGEPIVPPVEVPFHRR